MITSLILAYPLMFPDRVPAWRLNDEPILFYKKLKTILCRSGIILHDQTWSSQAFWQAICRFLG